MLKKSLSVLTLTAALASATAAEKPNIIFILADDLGLGDVNSFSSRCQIKTPNIDALVAEGVQFMDAHTSSSVSTPTRYGVLTGRYNWRTTLKSGVLQGYSEALIEPGRTTMASMLKSAGYTTACIGKWHLGWHWDGMTSNPTTGKTDSKNIDYSKPITNGPTTNGFDYFFGFCGSLDMAPYVWVENDMPTAVPTKITDNSKEKFAVWRKGLTSPDFDHERALGDITERTVAYIADKSKSSTPYFVYMPMPSPHTPILPTDEFRGKSGLNEYGDYVVRVDHYVGDIMAAVEASGEKDNTLIIFTADNGCSNRADFKDLESKGHYPSDIYRAMKASIYEGGHRVPCVVSYPAKFEHHVVRDQTICLTDFFATVADITGVKMADSEGEDSYSLVPLLKSSKPQKPIREATIHHSSKGEFAIRQGDWKLIYPILDWTQPGKVPADRMHKTKPELYNLASDPGEQSDVIAENQALATSMQQLLIKIIEQGRSTKGKPQKNSGPATGLYLGVDASRYMM